MQGLKSEIGAFTALKAERQTDAVQRVALQLLCGIDLPTVLGADAATRLAAAKRVERMIVRERLKGLRRHWSYDLNRHIALKQAFDRLRAAPDATKG